MYTIKATVDTKELDRYLNQLPSINKKVAKDAKRLGFAGLQYLKTIIPQSRLSKPHLRDSFKVNTQVNNDSVLLELYTTVAYGAYINADVNIPFRRPRHKRAMRFYAKSGDLVFATTARGFHRKGLKFVSKGEKWLGNNAGRFIDLSLARYVR